MIATPWPEDDAGQPRYRSSRAATRKAASWASQPPARIHAVAQAPATLPAEDDGLDFGSCELARDRMAELVQRHQREARGRACSEDVEGHAVAVPRDQVPDDDAGEDTDQRECPVEGDSDAKHARRDDVSGLGWHGHRLAHSEHPATNRAMASS